MRGARDETTILRRVMAILGPAWVWACAAVVVAVCLFGIVYLFVEGAKAITPDFLFSETLPSWDEKSSGGIRSPIGGTFIMAVLGLLFTVPVAVAAAIYLAEYVKEESLLARSARLGLEVLAGVPSVVFGMWGLALFSLPQLAFLSSRASGTDADAAFGRSFIVGAIVMAIHILPFVIKVMEENIRSVPGTYRAAAAALGMTKWQGIKKVILPAARPGLITAVILGLGLIVGDTAIVTLTVGGSMTMTGAEQWWLPQHWGATLLNTGSTLTTFVYHQSPAGEGNAPTKAFGAAFLLVLIVLALNLAVAFLGRTRRGEQRV